MPGPKLPVTRLTGHKQSGNESVAKQTQISGKQSAILLPRQPMLDGDFLRGFKQATEAKWLKKSIDPTIYGFQFQQGTRWNLGLSVGFRSCQDRPRSKSCALPSLFMRATDSDGVRKFQQVVRGGHQLPFCLHFRPYLQQKSPIPSLLYKPLVRYVKSASVVFGPSTVIS